MDRDVPPRIAYWASSFEGDMEAVSSEVACLRRAFPGSVSWGVSSRRPWRFSWRRGYGCPPRLHLAFRAATWCLQNGFDLNHLFGSLGDWFHLTAVRKRPTVLTVAVGAAPCDPELLARVDRFAVEWPAAGTEVEQLGVEKERIRLIPPPVDLERFTPSPPRNGPFTVLFASSPDAAEWLPARGIPALLDAAALRPNMHFRLVWRPWGDSLPRMRQWIAERGLSNVELAIGRFTDMPAQYRTAHATVLPFADRVRCKPAPNSLIESLASARPVLVTDQVGLADLVAEAGAGIVFPANGEALAAGLDALESNWQLFSTRARRLAESRFGMAGFVEGYRQLYRELV
jgi:glycosyltransferase involved in cell wall biosynthesis